MCQKNESLVALKLVNDINKIQITLESAARGMGRWQCRLEFVPLKSVAVRPFQLADPVGSVVLPGSLATPTEGAGQCECAWLPGLFRPSAAGDGVSLCIAHRCTYLAKIGQGGDFVRYSSMRDVFAQIQFTLGRHAEVVMTEEYKQRIKLDGVACRIHKQGAKYQGIPAVW